MVSASDPSSGGNLPAASGGVRKPRPDALLLSFSEYKPVEHAVWEAGQPTPYLHLAQAFQVRCGVRWVLMQRHDHIGWQTDGLPFCTRIQLAPSLYWYTVHALLFLVYFVAPAILCTMLVQSPCFLLATRRKAMWCLVVAGDGGHEEAPHHQRRPHQYVPLCAGPVPRYVLTGSLCQWRPMSACYQPTLLLLLCLHR